jgi:endonuclease/exonuclease/phosphatase family metal-dependent hydrolase
MLCIAAFAIVVPNGAVRSDEPPGLLRVMSYNIRYGTANDGINHWQHRRDRLIETISNFAPDLLGTQETLVDQRDFLLRELKEYEAVGVGRDDGRDAGEMAALFYWRERFEAMDSGHFWLSETPEQVGSKGWDAALPRIATWVKLRDRRHPDALPILFLNTHFDHRGERARAESASLVRTQLERLGTDCRWIVTGDFNADPSAPAYRNLFGDRDPQSGRLIDTLRAVRPTAAPDEGTFSGFDPLQTGGSRIDWIGCSEAFDVRLAGIDRDAFEGRTPSDHFPVTAVLRPKSPETEGTLRVLTYNIHHGEGTDGRHDLVRFSSLIRTWDPDLVALQEVDRGTKRSYGIDQSRALDIGTGMQSRFFRAIDFDGGEYGQAILSRLPSVSSEVVMLPNRDGREQRIAGELVVLWNEERLTFVTTHWDHADSPLRKEQSASLVSRYRDATGPVVLTGDLNATPERPEVQGLGEVWALAEPPGVHATFPSDQPRNRIDYVLASKRGGWRVRALVPIEEAIASDHRPVLAILERE